MKSDRSKIYFVAFMVLVFCSGVLITDHHYRKRFKDAKIIERKQGIDLTVDRVYFDRGVVTFNDKYFIILGRIQNDDSILNILQMNVPYHLYKKESNDTIRISNNDKTYTLVLK